MWLKENMWLEKKRPVRNAANRPLIFFEPWAGILIVACRGHFQFLDTGLFADQSTQIVEACTAHFTAFNYLNTSDVGIRVGKNALDTHAVRNFAHRKAAGKAVAFDLDHVAAEILFAGFVTFDDFVGDYDGVAGFETGEFRRSEHLLVDKLDGFQLFHCIAYLTSAEFAGRKGNFKAGKKKNIVWSFSQKIRSRPILIGRQSDSRRVFRPKQEKAELNEQFDVLMFNLDTLIFVPSNFSYFTELIFPDMKKLLVLPLLAVLAMAATTVTNYNVDTAFSNIVWTGYKVTGQHTGNVKVKNGNLQFADGKLTGGSFEIDMNTITTTDLQGEYADKLVGHLKSDDFFGVAAYPTAKFVITRVIPQDSKGNYKIIGNLTIKNTTKEAKFFANVVDKGSEINASGKLTVDRSEYDVKFGSGSFFDGLGDKTIYDEFDLQIWLVAKK